MRSLESWVLCNYSGVQCVSIAVHGFLRITVDLSILGSASQFSRGLEGSLGQLVNLASLEVLLFLQRSCCYCWVLMKGSRKDKK